MIIRVPTLDVPIVTFYICIFGPLWGFGILGIVSYNKTRLIFEGSNVIYRTIISVGATSPIKFGIVEMKISLNDIINVDVINRNIVIDIGEKHRKVIPKTFEDSEKILSMLKFYRP